MSKPDRQKSNWWRFGPVTIRTGSRNLASWGYPRLAIGGLNFWSWSNGGHLHLASYHPRACPTWHWFVALRRTEGAKPGFYDLRWRRGCGERGLCLFGWSLCLTQQGYHRERRA